MCLFFSFGFLICISFVWGFKRMVSILVIDEFREILGWLFDFIGVLLFGFIGDFVKFIFLEIFLVFLLSCCVFMLGDILGL